MTRAQFDYLRTRKEFLDHTLSKHEQMLDNFYARPRSAQINRKTSAKGPRIGSGFYSNRIQQLIEIYRQQAPTAPSIPSRPAVINLQLSEGSNPFHVKKLQTRRASEAGSSTNLAISQKGADWHPPQGATTSTSQEETKVTKLARPKSAFPSQTPSATPTTYPAPKVAMDEPFEPVGITGPEHVGPNRLNRAKSAVARLRTTELTVPAEYTEQLGQEAADNLKHNKGLEREDLEGDGNPVEVIPENSVHPSTARSITLSETTPTNSPRQFAEMRPQIHVPSGGQNSEHQQYATLDATSATASTGILRVTAANLMGGSPKWRPKSAVASRLGERKRLSVKFADNLMGEAGPGPTSFQNLKLAEMDDRVVGSGDVDEGRNLQGLENQFKSRAIDLLQHRLGIDGEGKI